MEAKKQNLRHFVDVLEEYMDNAYILFDRQFKRDKRSASGETLRKLDFKLNVKSDEYIVTFYAPDYYEYVEEGRKAGKMPPREAILKWIQVKKILPKPDKNGKLPSTETLAFLIARAIGKHGTIKDKGYKGGEYLADTVEEINDKYLPKLQEALEQDVAEFAVESFDKVTNELVSIFGK